MSKREQAVRSSSANECPAGHLSEGIQPPPPKDTPHYKSAVFLWILYYLGGSKIAYPKKTLIFTNLRTEIADSKASFYNKELCLNRSLYLYCLL